MPKHKRRSKAPSPTKAQAEVPAAPAADRLGLPLDGEAMVPGPQLRRILGISPVTLWWWRHDKNMGFPAAKCIQDRLYWPWKAVSAWLAAQQEVA